MSVTGGIAVPHPPLIIPEIGKDEVAMIEETVRAYERAADFVAELAPDTLVITSPHSLMYADYFHISPGGRAGGSFAQFGAGKVSFDVTYDEELVRRIEKLAFDARLPAGTLGERNSRLDHGTMVPLWFILPKLRDVRIVRTGLSGLPLADHYRLGEIIARAAETEDRNVVMVASGDLSHKLREDGPYGFDARGPEYDARVMSALGRGAFGELLEFPEDLCRGAAECGHRSFVIMAGAMDGRRVKAEALSHQDVTGVGYGVCTFLPGEADGERHFLDRYIQREKEGIERKKKAADPYVRLARTTIEEYIRHGQKPDPAAEELPAEMLENRAGVFVSIHEYGELRGCIGTIAPVTGSIAEEIIANAVSASTRDSRFLPVREDELELLDISVDVLGEPEDISSADELDVRRYGVIVSSRGRRGLLLPDLEGVETPRQQIEIASRKAGISAGEKIHLQRFEVVRHEQM